MTPAVRALESAGVEFKLHRYVHSQDADSFGLEAAAKLGVAPELLFKTLIAEIDGKQLVMALVPVAGRLDLKKLAHLVDGKRGEMASPATAQRATGYVVGGISPLGGRKQLPTFIDSSVLGHGTIFVSAGQRGLQVELASQDLLRLTGGTPADLTWGEGS